MSSGEPSLPQIDGVEGKGSTIAIAFEDIRKFHQIKGNMSFYKGKTVTNEEVMSELICTWLESKRSLVLKGETN